MVGNIRISFDYMDKTMIRMIIKTMISPKIEYAEVMWLPHKKKPSKKIGKISENSHYISRRTTRATA